MKRVVAITASLFLLAGCGEKVQGAPDVGTTTLVQQFEWRVINREQMVELHRLNGIYLKPNEVPLGMQGYKDGKAIIYTLPPKTVDDDVTLTLGHEVMHIAMGKYHD